MAAPLIVVVVPVLNRPHRVQPLVESFEASKARRARLLFVASPEDRTQLKALAGIEHLVMPHFRGRGDWAKKINYAYQQTSEPWILCGADDIHFHPGWDKHLLRIAKETGKRVLGTVDLGNPDLVASQGTSPHPFVARSYADELGTIDGPGAVLPDCYDHNFPDRELAATAISRGEWAYVPEAVIEHLHPAWGKGDLDSTYQLGRRNFSRDFRLFLSRSRQWGGDEWVNARKRREWHRSHREQHRVRRLRP